LSSNFFLLGQSTRRWFDCFRPRRFICMLAYLQFERVWLWRSYSTKSKVFLRFLS